MTRVALFLIFWLVTSTAFCAGLSRAVSKDTKSTRVALIIGNSSYREVTALPNPVNDASDLATALEAKGFTVLLREDVSERGLKEAVAEFAKFLKGGGVGVFFFAGHGVSLNGQNFLMPVDLSFRNPADIISKSVSAEYVLSLMSKAGNRVNIVILDACRNNPFDDGSGAAKQGLTAMSLGNQAGTFIAYATSPGSTASDGAGRNGLYTQNLLRALKAPDSDLDKVFGRVRTGVVGASNGEQVPWTTSSIIGSFYFDVAEEEAALMLAKKQGKTIEEVLPVQDASQPFDPAEAQAVWSKIRDSKNPNDYKEFISKYGGSPDAAFARFRLAKLEGGDISVVSAHDDQPLTKGSIFSSKVTTESTPAVEGAQPAAETTNNIIATAKQSIQTQPTVSSAKATLTAIAAPGTVIRDCPQCPELVVIPPGAFMMGLNRGPGNDPDEAPSHNVRIGQSLAVGKFEITKGQFASFIKASGHRPKGGGCYTTRGGVFRNDAKASWQYPGFEQNENEPVVCVSWEDTQAYLAWLWKLTNKQYRLLSEAEWEYAARGGETRFALPEGNASCKLINIADASSRKAIPGVSYLACNDGYTYTAPVGKFPVNSFGLSDMLGNAWEWVGDCWNEGYYNAPSDGSSWVQGRCGLRVFRGGGWNSSPKMMRYTYRDRDEKGERHDNLGFRVLRPLL